MLEEWEYSIATNPKESAELVGRYTQQLNAFLGLAKTLGLERKAKKATLSAYVEG